MRGAWIVGSCAVKRKWEAFIGWLRSVVMIRFLDETLCLIHNDLNVGKYHSKMLKKYKVRRSQAKELIFYQNILLLQFSTKYAPRQFMSLHSRFQLPFSQDWDLGRSKGSLNILGRRGLPQLACQQDFSLISGVEIKKEETCFDGRK